MYKELLQARKDPKSKHNNLGLFCFYEKTMRMKELWFLCLINVSFMWVLNQNNVYLGNAK